ncbi:hypothetical protein ACJX0J_031789 [Zea mays]
MDVSSSFLVWLIKYRSTVVAQYYFIEVEIMQTEDASAKDMTAHKTQTAKEILTTLHTCAAVTNAIRLCIQLAWNLIIPDAHICEQIWNAIIFLIC